MRRALAALGAAALALTALAGCGSDHEQGPAGQVVAKDKDRDCHTTTTGSGKKRRTHQSCDTEYELTTRDKQGGDHEFEVPSYVYDNCRRGSAYPGCIDR
ncbi:putative lipoprotein [Streptomyces turgidiscabies Car8]|uniref:Putative lipoprotein n=1 Tax=Streptomyces turgidiscabies (strain Car8) TaxID=698760 RepID=L7F7V8_STRT8|nr:hypothetical protein [Streptomyces turgidiscabies]ELP67678.1 putative lipoprotein [Streptomyces turgidiscabies Car8]